MSFYGLIPEGAYGHVITIEAQINLSTYHESDALDIRLLGLPQTALRQGIARWQNALKNSNLKYPPYEITINLAPADIPKPGTTLEAPIAAILGILGQTAEEQEKVDDSITDNEKIQQILAEIKERNDKRRKLLQRVFLDDWIVIGELRLTGELKSTRSLLGMISKAPKNAKIIVPCESEKEASLLLFKDNSAKIYCAKTSDSPPLAAG
jgi:predicted ATPase with chaperone activity